MQLTSWLDYIIDTIVSMNIFLSCGERSTLNHTGPDFVCWRYLTSGSRRGLVRHRWPKVSKGTGIQEWSWHVAFDTYFPKSPKTSKKSSFVLLLFKGPMTTLTRIEKSDLYRTEIWDPKASGNLPSSGSSFGTCVVLFRQVWFICTIQIPLGSWDHGLFILHGKVRRENQAKLL